MKLGDTFLRRVEAWLSRASTLTLALALAGCSTNNPVASSTSAADATVPGSSLESPVGDGKDASFSLTMLDVGQGLSVLIEADGEYLLYDGGGRSASSYVVSYLQQHGVDQVRWLVASHYDEDHISGLVGVLNTAEVEEALLPDYTTDTQIYQSLQNAIAEQNVPVVTPLQGDLYTLGNAEIEVVGPGNHHYAKDNDNSLCLHVSYGNFQCLLTGDAEQDAEEDMVRSDQDLSCDVYVVGHHGSASSSCDALLDAAAPQYAFLSVGAANPYGHPAEQTLESIRRRGIALYRTDKQGEVTVYSDGDSCWFSTASCEDWTHGTQTVPEESVATTSPQEALFILNTHTKKFHLPDCPSAAQIEEQNKAYTDASRDELLLRGYIACKRCAA